VLGAVSLALLGAGRRGHDATTFPFAFVDNRIMIECRIDGKGPFTLALDTGAGVTSVTPAVAKTLGLPVAAAGTTSGVGNATQAVQTTKLRTLRVGDFTFRAVPVYVLDLGKISERSGIAPFDGVLGEPELRAFAVAVDMDAHAITLSRTPLAPRPGSWTISFSGAIPHVGAEIDGQRGTVVLDTGDRSSLTLFGKFAKAHGFYARRPALRDALTGYGIGGPVYGDVFRVHHFTLFGVRIAGVVTRASRQKAGMFATLPDAGSVGGGVLRRFNVTYDYPRSVLVVSPSAQFAAAEPYDRSGLWLSRDGERIAVTAVTAGGPAQRAGVHANDILEALEGHALHAHDLFEVRRTLASSPAGTTAVLTLLRDGHRVQRSLALRDQI
jgi:aspartyl protease/PDZ domain-containing protein